MNQDYYIKIVNEKINSVSKEIMIGQINKYFKYKNVIMSKHNYKVGDNVYLKKGTLLHGTYKNIDSLREIVKDGLISSWFIDGRTSKYPSSVGVWNLKKDYLLKDYINFYSGGTIKYYNMGKSEDVKTEVIPYNEMNNIINLITNNGYQCFLMEQTKEARFMPSLVQEVVQIGIIFNADNCYIDSLKEGDILNENIDDNLVKAFVNEHFYDDFIKLRKKKDDFFTDRESAILFGIPANFIEGILVGRIYEKDNKILREIKELLPNCYICNLDGKVIVE